MGVGRSELRYPLIKGSSRIDTSSAKSGTESVDGVPVYAVIDDCEGDWNAGGAAFIFASVDSTRTRRSFSEDIRL